jgi:hypothetical protein
VGSFYYIKNTSDFGKALNRIYTSRGHKLRFFKELKTQGEQRIKVGFMSCHGFIEAL